MRQYRVFAVLLLAGCAFGARPDSAPRGDADAALWTLGEAGAAAREGPPPFPPAGRLGPPARRALALAGLGEIAEDRTDSMAAARHFVAALQAAPMDPIAELAAVRLLDLEGESPQIDEMSGAAARGLKIPVAPRAARLLREAAARIAGRQAALAADPRIEVEAWQSVGTVQRWRVGGPVGAVRLFDLRRQMPLDGKVPAAAAVNDRALEFPDGDVGLDLEPGDGDVYYAVSEVTLERGGEYLLLGEGAGAREARRDGPVAFARAPFPFGSPRAQTTAVRWSPGRHHVLVRWTRAEGNRFRLTLVRADGAASDLTSAAPYELSR